MACSSRAGSAAQAAARKASPGTKQTTSSGEGSNAVQYSLAARASTCERRARACLSAARRCRSSSSPAAPGSLASRKAASGALASTTTCLPPGRWTTRSGRTPTPSGVVATTCWVKSTRANIPACSTTRRSWTSPHVPRAVGERSAPGRAAVCARSASPEVRTASICSPRRAYCCSRSRSSTRTCSSTRCRAPASGESVAASSRSCEAADSRSVTRSRRRSRSATAVPARTRAASVASSPPAPPMRSPISSPASRAANVEVDMAAPCQTTPTDQRRRLPRAEHARGSEGEVTGSHPPATRRHVMEIRDMHGLLGRTAYGADGDRLGTITGAYLDNVTGRPSWITVERGGLLRTTRSFVPLDGVELVDDGVRVAVDADAVKRAPHIDEDKVLTRAEEHELRSHYGLAQPTAEPERPTVPSAGPGVAPEAVAPAPGSAPDPAPGSAPGSAPDPEAAAMTRSEERAPVGATTVPA